MPHRHRLHTLLAVSAVLALAALAAAFLLAGPIRLPDLAWLQARQSDLLAWHAAGPWAFGLALFALFTLFSALALPGCSLMALVAGLCLGWLPGTLLVVLASSMGATLSFLAARHLLRHRVQRRWGHRLAPIEAGLARDGAFYLFTLRLVPGIPYFVLNPLMGLSAMPTRQFFSVSLLGMLAGSAAYAYAGTALGRLKGWEDVFSPQLLAALLALAALPWLARLAWRARLRVLGLA